MMNEIARCLVVLATDYDEYGGDIKRWKDPKLAYPDCSCGCRHFLGIEGIEKDWGVCSNPNSPRKGLLTWEHQAGLDCFEAE